jgi:hypothetical protein
VLVVPIAHVPKLSLGGINVAGSTPEPVSAALWGLLLAPLLTLNSPVLLPNAVGVNVTLIVHLRLAARLVVHVVADTAKSPVAEIAMLVSSAVWLLVKVNVLATLVVPTL